MVYWATSGFLLQVVSSILVVAVSGIVTVLILHQVKKVILLVDAVTNGLWAFMWFVCFCFTANQLASNSGNLKIIVDGIPSIINCARSGVAFSFFSILIWVSCVCVCVCVCLFPCVRVHVCVCACMCNVCAYVRACYSRPSHI